MKCSILISVIATTVAFCPRLLGDSWVDYQMKRLEEISLDPSSQDIQLLATLATNKPNPDADPAGRAMVKELAWKRLISFPDFADRLALRIKEDRDQWQAGEKSVGAYDADRVHTLLIMARVRHPEMVKVLGRLLDDWEWPGWEGDPKKREELRGPNDGPQNSPNCVYAARALGQLVENPPLQKKLESYSWDEVEIWQLWYGQVKAGTRSFRIKGDPTNYKLDTAGTVVTAEAAIDSVPGKAGVLLPSSKATGIEGAGNSPETPSFPLMPVLLACGILGVGVVLVLRGRRRAA